jgi:hypothetical protein
MVCAGHTNTRWQYVPRMLLPIPLTYHIHHGVLCLLRVHALYGRSRRILGLLLFLGTGSIVTAFVRRLPLTLGSAYACLNIFLLPIKATIFSSRKAGGETIPVISPFVGCAQYTPHIGYVADSACCSSFGMIRLITLIVGVDVSHRVTYY